jgi:hypothetical protein
VKLLGAPGYKAPQVLAMLKAAGQDDLAAVMERAMTGNTRVLSRDVGTAIDNWLVARAEKAERDVADAKDRAVKEAKTAKIRAEFQRFNRDAGLERMEFHATQGLERTEANAQLVQKWLDANCRGFWSVAGVDSAISNLRGQLTWVQKAEPAPAPKPKIEYLPNGEERLPLNVPNAVLRRASKEQAADWLKRQRSS